MDTDISRTRIELKYQVPIDDVEAVVSEIPAERREDYQVSTLYFDTPDRLLSCRALRTPYECTKVRVREYQEGSPDLWIEVKSRNGAWTQKWRLPVPRATLERRLVEGEPLDLDGMGKKLSDDREEFKGARDSLEGIIRGPLLPMGTVCARRRTFALFSTPIRFTVDERISYHLPPSESRSSGLPGQGVLGGPLLHQEPGAVVELKHAGDVPLWCTRIVTTLTLSRYSKFRSLIGHLASSPNVADHVDRV
jgi:hypothetical protein